MANNRKGQSTVQLRKRPIPFRTENAIVGASLKRRTRARQNGVAEADLPPLMERTVRRLNPNFLYNNHKNLYWRFQGDRKSVWKQFKAWLKERKKKGLK